MAGGRSRHPPPSPNYKQLATTKGGKYIPYRPAVPPVERPKSAAELDSGVRILERPHTAIVGQRPHGSPPAPFGPPPPARAPLEGKPLRVLLEEHDPLKASSTYRSYYGFQLGLEVEASL